MPRPEVVPMREQDFKGINDALRNADNPDEWAKVEGYAADAYPALYAAYRQERERAERAEGMIVTLEVLVGGNARLAAGLKARADKLAETLNRIEGWAYLCPKEARDENGAVGYDMTLGVIVRLAREALSAYREV